MSLISTTTISSTNSKKWFELVPWSRPLLAPATWSWSTTRNTAITLAPPAAQQCSHRPVSNLLDVQRNMLLYCPGSPCRLFAPRLEPLQASSPCTWPLADYRLSFLFPDLRPPLLCGLDSPFALLFGAIDILPADYHQVVPSANNCLQLPVSACLRAVPNTPLNRSLRQLRLSSPYIKDPDSNLLHPRTATEFHVHPYLARKFLRLVRQNHILLAPFLVRQFIPVQYASLGSYPFTSNLTSVVDASPFLLSRKLITVDNSRCLRSKLFCRLCILPTSGSKILFPLPPDGWR